MEITMSFHIIRVRRNSWGHIFSIGRFLKTQILRVIFYGNFIEKRLWYSFIVWKRKSTYFLYIAHKPVRTLQLHRIVTFVIHTAPSDLLFLFQFNGPVFSLSIFRPCYFSISRASLHVVLKWSLIDSEEGGVKDILHDTHCRHLRFLRSSFCSAAAVTNFSSLWLVLIILLSEMCSPASSTLIVTTHHILATVIYVSCPIG